MLWPHAGERQTISTVRQGMCSTSSTAGRKPCAASADHSAVASGREPPLRPRGSSGSAEDDARTTRPSPEPSTVDRLPRRCRREALRSAVGRREWWVPWRPPTDRPGRGPRCWRGRFRSGRGAPVGAGGVRPGCRGGDERRIAEIDDPHFAALLDTPPVPQLGRQVRLTAVGHFGGGGAGHDCKVPGHHSQGLGSGPGPSRRGSRHSRCRGPRPTGLTPRVLCRHLLERVTGIEPAYSAWEADVLPLNYTRIDRPPEVDPCDPPRLPTRAGSTKP